MNKKSATKIRVGTQAESFKYQGQIRWQNNAFLQNTDADAIALPDGHGEAIRVMLEDATGKPALAKDGKIRVCAPWLMSGMFGPSARAALGGAK